MKMSVLPSRAVMGRPWDSRTRAVVVPGTATRRLRRVDGLGAFFAHAEALGVHPMRGEVFDLHRSECPHSDVQGDEGVRDHPQDFRSEVQPGGGRGDGAAFAREDRLVTLGIGGFDGAGKVRRKGQLSCGLQIHRAAERR